MAPLTCSPLSSSTILALIPLSSNSSYCSQASSTCASTEGTDSLRLPQEDSIKNSPTIHPPARRPPRKTCSITSVLADFTRLQDTKHKKNNQKKTVSFFDCFFPVEDCPLRPCCGTRWSHPHRLQTWPKAFRYRPAAPQ